MKQVVDVIFKWICVVLADPSTPVAIKMYDFLTSLFAWLTAEGYQLWDHEANVIIPLLCDKSGNNNVILKNKAKSLIKQCFGLYDHARCIAYIFDHVQNSKNLKSMVECLDEITVHISQKGMQNMSDKQIKVVARLIDHSDSGVKKSALRLIDQIYFYLEDDTWQAIGKVSIKTKIDL